MGGRLLAVIAASLLFHCVAHAQPTSSTTLCPTTTGAKAHKARLKKPVPATTVDSVTSTSTSATTTIVGGMAPTSTSPPHGEQGEARSDCIAQGQHIPADRTVTVNQYCGAEPCAEKRDGESKDEHDQPGPPWTDVAMVLLTLGLLVAAWIIGRRQVDLVDRQANIMGRQEQLTRALERPYLMIRPSPTARGMPIADLIGSRINEPVPSAPPPPLAAEYMITNAGRTPARITGRTATFTLAGSPEKPFEHGPLALRSQIPIGPNETLAFTADEITFSNLGSVFNMLVRRNDAPVQVLRFHAVVEYRGQGGGDTYTSHCAFVYRYSDRAGEWQVIDALPECNAYT